MKTILIFFLSILPFSSILTLEDSHTHFISFETLRNKEEYFSFLGTEIQISGFLHKSLKDEWILGSTPDIKTCCVGSQNKQNEQIYLPGDWKEYPSGYAITLQGTLIQNSNNGKWHLEEAKTIVKDKNLSWMFFLSLGSLIGIGAIIPLFLYRLRK